jgi:hypothetical protein
MAELPSSTLSRDRQDLLFPPVALFRICQRKSLIFLSMRDDGLMEQKSSNSQLASLCFRLDLFSLLTDHDGPHDGEEKPTTRPDPILKLNICNDGYLKDIETQPEQCNCNKRCSQLRIEPVAERPLDFSHAQPHANRTRCKCWPIRQVNRYGHTFVNGKI